MLILSLFLSVTNIIAAISWNGHLINEVLGERVYLYNANSDMYLYPDDEFGNKLVHSKTGSHFELIDTGDKDSDGNSLYRIRTCQRWTKVNRLDQYHDQYLGYETLNSIDLWSQTTGNKNSQPGVYCYMNDSWTWKISQNSSNKKIKLYIQREDVGGKHAKIKIDGWLKAINNNEYSSYILTDKESDAASFDIVTDADLQERFAKYTGNSLIETMDATWYISNPDFARMNEFAPEKDGTLDTDSWTLTTPKARKEWYGSGYDEIADGGSLDQHDNGKFFCAKIENNDLYQNLKLPTLGWYKLSCKGVRADKGKNDAEGSDDAAYLYVKWGNSDNISKTPIISQSQLNDHISKMEKNGSKMNDWGWNPAGRIMRSKKHSIFGETIYFLVSDLEAAYQIGVHVAEGNTAYIDKFKLDYIGDDFVLDENWTKQDSIIKQSNNKNNNKFSKHRTMILHRELVPNAWNAISLPIDISQDKCK